MLCRSAILATLLFAGSCFAQSLPDAPAPNTGAPAPKAQSSDQKQQTQQAPADQKSPDDLSFPEDQSKAAQDQANGTTDAKDQKQPGVLGRVKKRVKDQVSQGCVHAAGDHCWDKPAEDDKQQAGKPNQQPPLPDGQQLPRSDTGDLPADESSSKSKIDVLTPPPGDNLHPGADASADDVQEMKPWDPHKAQKNVEVGDYYFHERNYRAAESRYREALYWKENDAVATFRLAQALDKLNKTDEARKTYQAYLKILPEGEFAVEAKKALARLGSAAEGQSATSQLSQKSR